MHEARGASRRTVLTAGAAALLAGACARADAAPPPAGAAWSAE
jgi:hypothetical protein